MTKQDVVSLFSRPSGASALVIAGVAFTAAWFSHFAPLLAVAACVMFAAFDRLGFHEALGQADGPPRAAYRVMQVAFQHLLGALVCVVSWKACVGYYALWWSGVADAAYYVIGREEYLGYDPAPWLRWTWWGAVGIPVTGRNLRAYSVVALCVVIVGLFVW